MANIKTISRSDYAQAQKYAAKYNISISQSVKFFEDIEELEHAGKKDAQTIRAEMYARLRWESLKPASVVEEAPTAERDEIEDGLPVEHVHRKPETPICEEQPAIVESPADIEAAAEIETNGVLVGEPAMEIECANCGKLFWSLDSDHTECDTCDEAAGMDGQEKMLDLPVFKLGDKVRNTSALSLGVATVAKSWGTMADIVYENGVKEFINVMSLERYIDPRDAEIERLRKEIAQLMDERDRLIVINQDLEIEARMAEKTRLPSDITRAFFAMTLLEQTSMGSNKLMIARNHVISVLRGHIPLKSERETEDRGEAGKGIFF